VVLHAIVDSARNLVDARYAAIGVLDEDGDFTELITAGFGADQLRQDAGAELPHGTGLLGEPVRHPQPLRVETLAADPRAAGFPEGHPVMTTLLGVPIRVRSIVYGNPCLADKRSGAFTDDDQEILTALAGAAGVAIENARLYQRLRQATEEFQPRLLPTIPALPHLELQARCQPSSDAQRIGGCTASTRSCTTCTAAPWPPRSSPAWSTPRPTAAACCAGRAPGICRPS
jgi:transcriptional regulator with GAF, ATPase, and Fis domain